MPAPGAPDRGGMGFLAAEPPAEPMAADESQGPDQSSMGFLDRIGGPGLADIDSDALLPPSPLRDLDLG